MPKPGSLRRRIVSAYVLLAVVVSGLFAAAVVVTILALERDVVESRLSATADWLIQRRHEGRASELPPETAFYADAAIPAELAALSPGFHELDLHGRPVHVFMRRDEDGSRYAAVDEQTDFETIEWRVYAVVAFGIATSVLLALLLGRLTASRVIAPVTALAGEVERDGLRDDSSALASNDEIGVLARAFAARSKALDAALAREQMFSADVSHELRTPLTVILGAAEVLARDVEDRPALAAAVERIRRTASETAERVSALLLLSRSPEKLDAPRIDLQALIASEIERCQRFAAGKPLRLTLHGDDAVYVRARPELAGILVSNLLRNSCQYTDEGEVTVHLRPGLLTIEDTGPGLPQEVRARLFERFVRGPREAVSGSGLGFAIVQRVADHLGWTFRIEDGPHGGTRFVVDFAAGPTQS